MNTANLTKNISKLLSPSSIAIVGASRNRDKVGNKVVRNLLLSSFKGKIFLVNREAEEIYNIKCHKSISEIKENIDLVWIRVCFREIQEIVSEAIKKEVKTIVLNTKFPDTKEADMVLREIKKLCDKNNVVVLGDGAGGIWSEDMNMLTHTNFPKLGKVSFLSQSDALSNSFIDLLKSDDIGIKHVITLGTKRGIKESDMLEVYLQEYRLKPSILCMYLEQVNETERFELLLSSLSKQIPIIILMPNESNVLKQKLWEHTRSKVQDNELLKIFFERTGVHFVTSIMEMTNLIMYYSSSKLTDTYQDTFVLSNSFYLTIEANSLLNKYSIPILEETYELKEKLNLFYSKQPKNENDYIEMIEKLFKIPTLTTVLLSFTKDENIDFSKLAKGIDKLKNVYSKNVIVSVLESKAEELKVLNTYMIATYKYIENGIWSLSKAINRDKILLSNSIITTLPEQYVDILEDKKIKDLSSILAEAKKENEPILSKSIARDILKAFNFSFENDFQKVNSKENIIYAKVKVKRESEMVLFQINIFSLGKTDIETIVIKDLMPFKYKNISKKLSNVKTITNNQKLTLELELKRTITIIEKMMNILGEIEKCNLLLVGDNSMNLLVRDYSINLVV